MGKSKETRSQDKQKCRHPPERLYSGFARDDTAPRGVVFWVGCCQCGKILR